MQQRVFFIDSVLGVKDLFNGLLARYAPGTASCHIADESIIQDVLRAGGPTPYCWRRVCEHVVAAADAGATVIQVTCSSITPCVATAAPLVGIPVLTADEAMITAAVRRYRRIGVIATNPGTLAPSTQHVRDVAQRLGREARVTRVLCEGAYDAFFRGDLATHDAIVRRHLQGLMRRVDVVLLAQASMARVADAIPAAERRVPLVSSPGPAMKHLAGVLKRLAATSKR